MTAKTVVTAVAFALVVAGCALAPSTNMAACKVHVCHVVVTVTECQISLVPPDIDVYGHGHEIHWDIATAGYTFPKDGIWIKDDDPKHEFDDPRRVANDTKFIWNDKNSFAQTYRYGVKVMKGATACAPLDPGIINHG
ncbi:MAG: hypothetical protein M3R40_06410 [Pseudomonadota bacterium]|nr:hypothetical protein [Pseudomonadota bacterium]